MPAADAPTENAPPPAVRTRRKAGVARASPPDEGVDAGVDAGDAAARNPPRQLAAHRLDLLDIAAPAVLLAAMEQALHPQAAAAAL